MHESALGLKLIKDPLKRSFLERFLEALKLEYGAQLVSAAVFGSSARGEDSPDSDLDLVLILDTSETISQRCSRASRILTKLMKCWISEDRGWYPRLDAYLLSLEEAAIFRPIYLELYADGIILHDPDGFLSKILSRLGEELSKLGSIRIKLQDGSWAWILKPDLKFGDEFRIGIQ